MGKGGGGGLAFLNKKSWHTGSFKSQEAVWKAEHKAEQEEKKSAELRKQIQEERQAEELRSVAAAAGHKVGAERLEFMYSFARPAEPPPGGAAGSAGGGGGGRAGLGGASGGGAAAGGAAALAAGVARPAGELLAPDAPTVKSANEAWAKLHADPMLLIRQQELAARQKVKQNPHQMDQINREVAAALAARAARKAEKRALKKEAKRIKKEHRRREKAALRGGGGGGGGGSPAGPEPSSDSSADERAPAPTAAAHARRDAPADGGFRRPEERAPRRHSPSPVRRRSPSPTRRRSPSPRRRSRSPPPRRRSPSPSRGRDERSRGGGRDQERERSREDERRDDVRRERDRGRDGDGERERERDRERRRADDGDRRRASSPRREDDRRQQEAGDDGRKRGRDDAPRADGGSEQQKVQRVIVRAIDNSMPPAGKSREFLHDALTSNVIFRRAMGETSLAQLIDKLRKYVHSQGEVVATQESPPDNFYIIEKGAVMLWWSADDVDTELVTLGAGSFLGEIELAFRGAQIVKKQRMNKGRPLTMTVLSPSILWGLPFADLLALDKDGALTSASYRAALGKSYNFVPDELHLRSVLVKVKTGNEAEVLPLGGKTRVFAEDGELSGGAGRRRRGSMAASQLPDDSGAEADAEPDDFSEPVDAAPSRGRRNSTLSRAVEDAERGGGGRRKSSAFVEPPPAMTAAARRRRGSMAVLQEEESPPPADRRGSVSGRRPSRVNSFADEPEDDRASRRDAGVSGRRASRLSLAAADDDDDLFLRPGQSRPSGGKGGRSNSISSGNRSNSRDQLLSSLAENDEPSSGSRRPAPPKRKKPKDGGPDVGESSLDAMNRNASPAQLKVPMGRRASRLAGSMYDEGDVGALSLPASVGRR